VFPIHVPEGWGVLVYGNNPVVVEAMRPDGEIGTMLVGSSGIRDETDETVWPDESIAHNVLSHMATVVSGNLNEARLTEEHGKRNERHD
jgi:hypothetical protein